MKAQIFIVLIFIGGCSTNKVEDDNLGEIKDAFILNEAGDKVAERRITIFGCEKNMESKKEFFDGLGFVYGIDNYEGYELTNYKISWVSKNNGIRSYAVLKKCDLVCEYKFLLTIVVIN